MRFFEHNEFWKTDKTVRVNVPVRVNSHEDSVKTDVDYTVCKAGFGDLLEHYYVQRHEFSREEKQHLEKIISQVLDNKPNLISVYQNFDHHMTKETWTKWFSLAWWNTRRNMRRSLNQYSVEWVGHPEIHLVAPVYVDRVTIS